MNKYAKKITLLLLQYLGAFIGGDTLDDDIVADLTESGKSAHIIDYQAKPEPEPDKVVDPPDDPDELEEEPVEMPKPKPDATDPVAKINEKFGTEFKTMDDFYASDIPDSYKNIPGYKKSIDDRNNHIAAMKQRLDELETEADPLSHFASPEEYTRQQLLKAHPDLDPAVLSRVVLKDLDKMNPVDLLAMKLRLKDGDIYTTEKEAREAVLAEYEIDEDTSLDELDPLKRNKIKKAAKDARIEMDALKAEVKLPSKEAITAQRKALQDATAAQWTPFVTQLPEQLKTIKLLAKDGTVEFEYPVEASFTESLSKAQDKIIEDMARKGYEFTAEKQQDVVAQFTNFYIAKNFDKIARAYAKDLVSKMDQAQFEAIHNPRPLRRDSRPEPDNKDKRALSKAKAEAAIEADLI
jgi:hypothetical protein